MTIWALVIALVICEMFFILLMIRELTSEPESAVFYVVPIGAVFLGDCIFVIRLSATSKA
jgi:hypothetical protein